MLVRVYSPEASEPFDVSPSKADDLVLNKGWTKTPWTKVQAAPDPEPVEEPVRGRGRRRRAVEEAPIEHFHGPAPFAFDGEPEADSWRS